MAETQSRPRLVRFGAFEADVQTGELRKDGMKLKFSGQPFQVLAILLERPGEVVTREELQKRLWPDTFVDVERNLNTAVNKIREVLGDSAENPRFVETLARRGYRFIGEVEAPVQPAVPAVTVKPDGGPSESQSRKFAEDAAPSPAPPRPIWRRTLPWAAVFLTGTLLAGIAFLILALHRPHPSAMHFRAVTNFSGVQSHPALSPDGRSVAFVSDRDGHYNIYVGLLNGANPVKITDDPNLKTTPCWSPDGTEIAYARLNDSGIWDIWRVPALGGTSRRFVLNASDPAWSRDGRWFAYRKSSTAAIWISDASGQNGRELARAQNELFGNSGPRFSPDGREVAYAASLGGPSGELEIVDVDSGKVRRVTHDAALVLSPAWSANGRFIYFASSRGGAPNIWKIAEKGGEPEQITSGQGDDIQLDISADGKRIVFSTFRSNVNLAELDLGPGEPQSCSLFRG
jgi:DNA-binding winged helix-turn-helix (wHTH) protein